METSEILENGYRSTCTSVDQEEVINFDEQKFKFDSSFKSKVIFQFDVSHSKAFLIDKRKTTESSLSDLNSEDDLSHLEILSHHRQILFDRAFGQMMKRHFYLVDYHFESPRRFEGFVLTRQAHRYKVSISFQFSCSCRRFPSDYVCKHFLFVLKRFFNVNLYSFDLRLAIMQYHQFTDDDLERIFKGQCRRLCRVALPGEEQQSDSLVFRRKSIDRNDLCPICFEHLLIDERKLVTCFHSCGRSIHRDCMKKWKRIQKKSTCCPLCQAPWFEPRPIDQTVLDFYAERSKRSEKREKYILCCLYTPPSCC